MVVSDRGLRLRTWIKVAEGLSMVNSAGLGVVFPGQHQLQEQQPGPVLEPVHFLGREEHLGPHIHKVPHHPGLLKAGVQGAEPVPPESGLGSREAAGPHGPNRHVGVLLIHLPGDGHPDDPDEDPVVVVEVLPDLRAHPVDEGEQWEVGQHRKGHHRDSGSLSSSSFYLK